MTLSFALAGVDDAEANGRASIGRVIVHPRLRGQGIGQYGCSKSDFRRSSSL
jgi:predicted GNAT family N-acyltransferase